ncbi:hypothetical protein KC351_g51 [Hortaea werneckii]|nr:hypothetical protein KC351_g51 [Hortaea werneckii]
MCPVLSELEAEEPFTLSRPLDERGCIVGGDGSREGRTSEGRSSLPNLSSLRPERASNERWEGRGSADAAFECLCASEVSSCSSSSSFGKSASFISASSAFAAAFFSSSTSPSSMPVAEAAPAPFVTPGLNSGAAACRTTIWLSVLRGLIEPECLGHDPLRLPILQGGQ